MIRIFFIILISAFFVSCTTTRTYEKISQQIYQDDLLIGEETSLVTSKGNKINPNNKKTKEKSGLYVSTFDIDGVQAEAKTVISKNSESKDLNIKIYKNDKYITERNYKIKNGKAIEDSSKKPSAKTRKEIENYMEERFEIESLDTCFDDAIKIVLNQQSLENNTGTENLRNIVSYEKTIVESKPNGKYIAYSFLGKPFVILGASTLNLFKSFGYAFINFLGGYSTVQYDDFFWVMPDVIGAKERADQAKIENQIAYSEYHIPFTDNHISIDKTNGETETRVSEINPEEINVTSTETHEFDNSLSVKKSIEKDVNRTVSVVGWIGTIITVPISAITWVFGAIFGLRDK